MASRAFSELRFSQLSKDAATVNRDIDTTRLTRLLELGGEFESRVVKVDFAFTMAGDRPLVTVVHDFTISRPCQWCLQPKTIDMRLQASTMLAASEEQASAWQAEDDATYIAGRYQEAIAVANPNGFDEVAWLEDELLAAWPSQVCADEMCSLRPSSKYQGNGDTDLGTGVVPKRANPFAVLEQLQLKSDAKELE